MTLIDTHSHIYLPDFDPDKDSILERADKEGISKILLPAIDSSTHLSMLRLEENNPATCLSMMGVHPCSVKENYKEELKIARDYLEKRPFKAVGEIGLDFYWDRTFTEQQYAAFHEQIEWALHFGIPIAIHSRNATDECIKVVGEHQQGKLKGVFHCFSGNAVQAQEVIDLGFYLGIGGVVTFKKSGLDEVTAGIDMRNLVLETDAPYLAPVPFRGKRNEPSYLKYVIDKIAEIKKSSREEVAAITTANAEKLFRL
ncbi:MAG: TatD family hydrolase [Ferruginibacter sp.]|nr:TatD family hydrolase [Chitinophagaceae bacterium]